MGKRTLLSRTRNCLSPLSSGTNPRRPTGNIGRKKLTQSKEVDHEGRETKTRQDELNNKHHAADTRPHHAPDRHVRLSSPSSSSSPTTDIRQQLYPPPLFCKPRPDGHSNSDKEDPGRKQSPENSNSRQYYHPGNRKSASVEDHPSHG